MTEAPDPLMQAFADSLPGLRGTQRKGWALLAATGVVTLAAFVLLMQMEEAFGFAVGAAFVGVFVGLAVVAWVRRSHERTLMPLLAQAFGLDHSKGGRDFFKSLPSNFIPLGGRRSNDDLLNGKVGGRPFGFSEVKTETGGKNSRTLFQGVVIEVPCAKPLPEFLIAPTSQTKGFWLFKGNIVVDGMTQSHSAKGQDGTDYGLWSRSPEPAQIPGLQAFLDRMVQIGPQVLGSSSLYSVVSSGRAIHVSLRHERDLFSIGGLWASEAEILAQVRHAAGEIDLPLTLVTEILRAEAALHAARGA